MIRLSQCLAELDHRRAEAASARFVLLCAARDARTIAALRDQVALMLCEARRVAWFLRHAERMTRLADLQREAHRAETEHWRRRVLSTEKRIDQMIIHDWHKPATLYLADGPRDYWPR